MRLSPRHCLLALALSILLMPAQTLAQHRDDRPADSPPTHGLLEQADAIAEKVSTLRGLELKQPLQRDVRTRAQLRTFLIDALAQDYAPEEILSEELTLKALGLIPHDVAYEALILDLLTSQIAGFYDPRAKHLYIMTGLASAIQAPTMAHEIFHALQDQHFDLLSLQGPFSPTSQSDFSIARSALFEGDATVLMLDYTLHESRTLPQPASSPDAPPVTTMAMMPPLTQSIKGLSLNGLMAMESLMGDPPKDAALTDSAVNKAPPIVKESLLFPYLAGLRFTLIAFEKVGSWSAFYDTIYASAPVSTEQILHPERYFARDLPTILSFSPDVALPSHARIYDNVLGEFQMHVALRSHLRFYRPKGAPLLDVDVDAAVEGWGGDRLMTFQHQKAPLEHPLITVHLSSWDDASEAAQYYEALSLAMKSRYHAQLHSASLASAGSGQATYLLIDAAKTPAPDDTDTLLYIEQWGDTVLHIEGLTPPGPKEELSHAHPPLKSLRDQIYASLERVPFQKAFDRAVLEEKKKDAAQDTPRP